jgi:hypothetical protein
MMASRVGFLKPKVLKSILEIVDIFSTINSLSMAFI